MKSLILTLAILSIFLFSNCVQETHLKTLIFKVDMSNVENIIDPSVHGQFTSPSWEVAVPLSDEDNDGIYEATAQVKAAQYSIQFKFSNNNEYELEGQNNRFVTLEYKPETIIYNCVYDNPKGQQKNP